jgi:hypothetical protein
VAFFAKPVALHSFGSVRADTVSGCCTGCTASGWPVDAKLASYKIPPVAGLLAVDGAAAVSKARSGACSANPDSQCLSFQDIKVYAACGYSMFIYICVLMCQYNGRWYACLLLWLLCQHRGLDMWFISNHSTAYWVGAAACKVYQSVCSREQTTVWSMLSQYY